MKKYKMLVLTDHSTHSAENSLYELLDALRKNPRCALIDVASRGLAENHDFFYANKGKELMVSRVGKNFAFYPDGHAYTTHLKRVPLRSYDLMLIRLPPPSSIAFFEFLSVNFWEKHIINRPRGILTTGSKAFLLNFPDLCPAMQLCEHPDQIIQFSQQHPIVLKPLYNYGGRGLVRIDGEQAWEEQQPIALADFLHKLKANPQPYLAMEYLPNVQKGDKRIIVVNERILGASLRIPPPGSWLCNAAQGGKAIGAEPDEHELIIAQRLGPVLKKEGIVMFGFDTLVNNQGQRVLSEINTMSIGGLVQIARQSGRPTVQEAADEIWSYVKNEMYGDVSR